jgi:hypothetical protein
MPPKKVNSAPKPAARSRTIAVSTGVQNTSTPSKSTSTSTQSTSTPSKSTSTSTQSTSTPAKTAPAPKSPPKQASSGASSVISTTPPTTQPSTSVIVADPIQRHYEAAGWHIIKLPKTCPVDYIATKLAKVHFILARELPSLPVQNIFIQNAMSNFATPIFANPSAGQVTLQDINIRHEVKL